MKIDMTDLLNSITENLKRIDYIKPEEIPNIDLYMDQVTTFMDEHLAGTKRRDEDKILTKTMINNYSKNNLLPPSVKKKYSKEHVLLLIFIYYFKSILSIKDIEIVTPEEKNKIYVKLKSGAGRQESVQIPSKIISGKPYVDFGYFAGQSGITYKYDEKHKKITLKKESRDSGKKEEKKSRQVIIWDPEHEFSTSSIKDAGKDNAIIISPTWGSYKDVSQNDFVPDLVYLKGIKDNGFNVLPLIHNDFDIPGTSAFMHDSKMQEKLISRIDAISEVYDLGGYNIDFENMKQEDKNLYTDFIKKLSGAMHEQGKMVTVDVTVYNEWSPTWSLCYDRENLAKAADYLVIMGYDETPGNSTVPGSVASYSWLDDSIKVLKKSVPGEKMILGLPLYTRVWVNESGRWKSRVLTLKYTDQFISRHKLRPVWNDEEKQYTSSWKEKGTAYKTWLEDAKSLEDKMSLVGKYGLGGTAFWRYGFEAENTFSELLNVKENQEKNGKIDIDNFSLHDYLAEKKQKLQEMQE